MSKFKVTAGYQNTLIRLEADAKKRRAKREKPAKAKPVEGESD